MGRTQRSLDHIVLAVSDLEVAAARYEALGFTLTPRAEHAWGTANRLAQFAGRCFIEILSVDRPQKVAEHSRTLPERGFDFGGFNRDFLGQREGASMLVLSGGDARADCASFAPLGGHPPFDFERKATLPDGSSAKVAFSLAFASDPALPHCGFFTCQNHFPDVFWKPAFQGHANGAETITVVVLAADEPGRHAAFLERFTGAASQEISGGLRFALGEQAVLLLEPRAAEARFPGERVSVSEPHFFGIVLKSSSRRGVVTPAAEACGMAIAWED